MMARVQQFSLNSFQRRASHMTRPFSIFYLASAIGIRAIHEAGWLESIHLTFNGRHLPQSVCALANMARVYERARLLSLMLDRMFGSGQTTTASARTVAMKDLEALPHGCGHARV